jgi:hypothetical protein
MVFEGIVEKILNSIFGKFIDGIDKKTINIAILTG